jgi:Ca-activated chloride channel family protein
MRLRSVSAGHRFSEPLVSLTFLCVAAALCLASVVSQASETAANNIVFILDASGSMAAPIHGRPKIDVAKEVLSGLVKELPSGVNVGLVAYGHREKKDCKDVEELAPLGPLNKNALIARIKAVKPKGMTPITYAVTKVADGLKSTEGETTVVLVSDGEETCAGDPCVTVKDLKASGINFVMHVIGFDVGEKERGQLECIARAGGGSYFPAKDADEFKIAAQKAVEKKEPPAPPKVEPSPEAALKITALRNGKPFSARFLVFKIVGDDDKQKQQVASDFTGEQGKAVKLPPGAYSLEVTDLQDAGQPKVSFNDVVLETGKTVEKIADFSGGTLRIGALRNGKPVTARFLVYRAAAEDDKKKQVVASDFTGNEGKTVKLPPGEYELEVQDYQVVGQPKVTFTGITMESGKTVEKIADFSGGTLKIGALRNGKPVTARFLVYKAAAEDDKKKQVVASDFTGNEGKEVKLPPGEYELEVQDYQVAGQPKVAMAGIVIEAGKAVEKVANFAGGELKIIARKNGKPFSARFVVYKAGSEDEKKRETVASDFTGNEGKAVQLPPGSYEVVVQNNQPPDKKEFQGVAVEAGEARTLEAQF